MQEQILILDFGSQYTQLIARRLRELNVYCEIHPYNKIPTIGSEIKGVILSGSPHSVREENPPKPELTNIKGKLFTTLVVGDKSLIDQKVLEKYGTVKTLSLQEIFGY